MQIFNSNRSDPDRQAQEADPDPTVIRVLPETGSTTLRFATNFLDIENTLTDLPVTW